MRSSMVLSRDEAPTLPESQDEGVAVSPPREEKLTDLTRAAVPLPFMLTVLGSVVAIAFFVFSIKNDVSLIEARLESEREVRIETEKRRDAQFSELSAQINNAGLRNANMSMAQEVARLMQDIQELKKRGQ